MAYCRPYSLFDRIGAFTTNPMLPEGRYSCGVIDLLKLLNDDEATKKLTIGEILNLPYVRLM